MGSISQHNMNVSTAKTPYVLSHSGGLEYPGLIQVELPMHAVFVTQQ